MQAKPRRVFAFIDRPNIDRTTKDLLGFRIDWGRLYEHLKSETRKWRCEKVYIYGGAKETQASKMVAKFTKLGYEAKIRPSKPQKDKVRVYDCSCGTCSTPHTLTVTTPGGIKSNCDVALTVDAMLHIEEATDLILFSGDGDFEPLILHAIERGVHMWLVSNTGRDKKGDRVFSSRLQIILDEEIASGQKRVSFIDIRSWEASIKKAEKPVTPPLI